MGFGSALMLLRRGADPNNGVRLGSEEVWTPLWWAARYGSTEVCRSLLASGARLDVGGGELG